MKSVEGSTILDFLPSEANGVKIDMEWDQIKYFKILNVNII